MLTVVHDADSSNEDAGSSRSLLDEIVRDGASQMLAAALRAEVAAYIEAHAGELDENGHRLVVRNGYHREREVLIEIAHGLSNQEIADKLFISLPTVKTHVAHILSKNNARDRVQAVVFAYENHLV